MIMAGLIFVDNVSMTFGGPDGRFTVKALDRVSLDIHQGELFSLIGPSGCGKSTLLSIMGGLARASEGEVRMGAEVITKPLHKKVAMVFQQYTLLPWRTILENVEIGLEFQGMDKNQRREIAFEKLDIVGLSQFSHFYPRQLSGGMRQRVAIARALSVNPEILLMDEPFGALDEQTRTVLGEELMRILERTRKTIVFVTHSIVEAVYLSDRIAVMTARPGRIKMILDIELPHPREGKMMTSDGFNHYRNLIFGALHEESLKVAAQSLGTTQELSSEG